MSGFGSSSAGASAFGFDVMLAGTSPNDIAPEGVLFDLITRDVVIDAEGGYVAAHPVDSKVQLALGIPVGAVPSVTDLGGVLSQLEIDDDDVMVRQADRLVRLALADMLAAGDVALLEVAATSPDPQLGRARLFVRYENRRLPSQLAQDRIRKLLLG